MSNATHPKNDLIVHTLEPFNAEPALDRLRSSFTTAVADFYVRSHGNIPRIEEDRHRLRITGRVGVELDLSMADLRSRLPAATVTAVMQCAGNRRADLQGVRKTSGDPWAPGAIGNAEWTGAPLAALLRAAGAHEDDSLHVAFRSDDVIDMPSEGRFNYGVSIPMSKAMSPETLVAYAMNGEALTPEHGFPLRMVVPGYAGVRSAKWLTAINVQDAPSDNHMQQRDYKLLPPGVTEETVDWNLGVVINGMPLNSAICEPKANATLPSGPVRARGYAIATGRRITRVDLSPDGGRTWQVASLERRSDAPWSWTFWEVTLDLAAGAHELVVRAWDCAAQTQPSEPEHTWNFKGYLSAAWHRVPVLVV